MTTGTGRQKTAHGWQLLRYLSQLMLLAGLILLPCRASLSGDLSHAPTLTITTRGSVAAGLAGFHPRPLSAAEQKILQQRCRQRLPQYESLFRQAAHQYALDWQLLAAVSYQESHWHPKAKSPTGVRGLMMLTRQTAKELGINNRLDPAQSVKGGACYLRKLHDRLPKEIQEPDRTWMALAAYNVGYGHLQDARELTRRKGMNPNHWHEVMHILPLLEDPQWHGKTRYGYARGREPVKYVEQIRSFNLALNQQPASMPSSRPGGGGKKH
ncbi:transglycosylase SLT domain-containing protein [Spongorhabdus nitratireducens]